MKINPCPKCGREPVSMRVFTNMLFRGWRVKCLDCELHTGCCETRDEAVEKWNELTKGVNK